MTERGQRKRIGRRAVKHEEHFAIYVEDFTDQVGGPRRPWIVAVADGVAQVGLGQRGPGFGTDAGIVVAGEMAPDFNGVFHEPSNEWREGWRKSGTVAST